MYVCMFVCKTHLGPLKCIPKFGDIDKLFLAINNEHNKIQQI